MLQVCATNEQRGECLNEESEIECYGQEHFRRLILEFIPSAKHRIFK